MEHDTCTEQGTDRLLTNFIFSLLCFVCGSDFGEKGVFFIVVGLTKKWDVINRFIYCSACML